MEVFAGLVEEVEFVPVAIPVEVKVGLQPLVAASLECFENDQILEELAHQGVAGDLLIILDVQQMAGKSGIDEKEFRLFDSPFPEMLKVWG